MTNTVLLYVLLSRVIRKAVRSDSGLSGWEDDEFMLAIQFDSRYCSLLGEVLF